MVFSSVANSALIVAPPGLNPGDPFRIIIAEVGRIDATSSNINTYDLFVQSLAVLAGLDTYNSLPVTWSALGSTTTVSAVSRLPNSMIPIYLIDGQIVANSSNDIWSGSLLHAINLDQFGAIKTGTYWTGSDATGHGFAGQELGTVSGITRNGSALNSNFGWITNNFGTNISQAQVYMYSKVLNVASVPEPSTLVLLSAGFFGLCMRRRKSKG